jgi:hypothetical protein
MFEENSPIKSQASPFPQTDMRMLIVAFLTLLKGIKVKKNRRIPGTQ